MLIILPLQLFCQTISGKIENINGEKVQVANIMIKDSLNATEIKEYTISKNGFFNITLKEKYENVVVLITAKKYVNEYFIIERAIINEKYHHDFILIKDTVVQLADVIIKAKTRPFQISGDTVKYNVLSYLDGSERKVQDVIIKLPGIVVNEKTGEIKYKGKSVETVTLDGENLFASDYAIGTKNINVDMIEQVQAIENYSDNPILKGIESGDKVSLNIKLKKKKTDYSGNVDFGIGLLKENLSAFDVSTNILGISKKFKSFVTLSTNNIGINNTPFDYFSYNPNVDQLKESDYYAKKNIPETFFTTEIDPLRSNINNLIFGSYNSSFRLTQQVNVKTNFYYLRDKLSSRQYLLTENTINEQRFFTSDNLNINKKPVQYRGDIEIKWKSTNTTQVEYRLKLKKETINTATDILQNNNSGFKTNLLTNDLNFKQTLLMTERWGENKALQMSITQSSNNIPQTYSFSPGIKDSTVYSSNTQLSNFKKNILEIQSTLLGNFNKHKYFFSIGLKNDNNHFFSNLQGVNNENKIFIPGFVNGFQYQKTTLYNSANCKLNLKRFKLTPSYTISFIRQNLKNKITLNNENNENYIFEPSFSLAYKINNVSAFLSSISYNQKPFSEEYFFEKPIFISKRVIKNNEVSLNFQKITVVSAFYLFNNLNRQFQFNFGLNISNGKGNYFQNLEIREENTKSKLFYSPQVNKNFNVNGLIEKYISFLQSTSRFKCNYAISKYMNIINNSDFRLNTSRVFTGELFFKTGFNSKLNFENNFNIKKIKSFSQNTQALLNRALYNTFKIIIKPTQNLFLLCASDYYIPAKSQNAKSYLFVDASLNYVTKKKIYEFRITAKNVLDNVTFSQVEINDFSRTFYEYNLLSRHFLINISRNF